MNILVLVATEEEFKPYESLVGVESGVIKDVPILRKSTSSGVFIVAQTGIGKLAAVTSYLAVVIGSKVSFDLVINAGLCGSLRGDPVGKMYFCTALVEHDLDLTLFGHERYPLIVLEDQYATGQLVNLVDMSPALIISGDKFIQGPLDKELIDLGASICDMESVAIYKMHEVINPTTPITFLKIVSDSASSEEYEKNHNEVSHKIADVVLTFANLLFLGKLL